MELNQLSSQIIRAAINVHKELGPGLLESVYQLCMVIELKKMGMRVQSEVPLPIFYRGQSVHEEGFRLKRFSLRLCELCERYKLFLYFEKSN